MFKNALILVALLALPLSSNAAFIDNVTFVTDTSTNTDYLKLSQVNADPCGYFCVVDQDIYGHIAAGWAVASQATVISADLSSPDFYNLVALGMQPYGTSVVTNNDTENGQPLLNFGIVQVDDWPGFGVYTPGVGGFSWGAPLTTQVLLSRPSVVPLPAAAWLFGSALFGLIGVARRKKA